MNQEEQADKSESNEGCQLVLELKEIWYIAIARNWVSLLACENSRPSLPAQVAFPSREMPLAPGAKKDGCFRRLGFCGKFQIMHHSRTEKVLGGGGGGLWHGPKKTEAHGSREPKFRFPDPRK